MDSTQAILIIIFYFGPGDSPPYRLDKKYLVKNWTGEAHLRQLLDELAAEMNHLSGYGIWSMVVKGNGVNFRVDYKERFRPYEIGGHESYSWFRDTLRFKVGQRRNSPVYLEIPRIHFTTGAANPVKKYDPADNLLQIKAQAVGGPKKQRKAGTYYHIFFDYENPILASFLARLSAEGMLEPYTLKKKWTPYPGNLHPVSLSWWTLAKAQTTSYKMDKWRKEQEKKARQRQQQEKRGVVYKDKKQTKKADQVYLIQMGEDNVYKIGISNAPGKRLQSLNTSSPFELKLVHHFVAEPAADAEAHLHSRFAAQHLSGEWFRLEPAQVVELKRITAFKGGQFITKEA